jgi:hypothetical protein
MRTEELRRLFAAMAAIITVGLLTGNADQASAQKKPNILVIWGDDVGQWLQSFKEFPPRQKPGSFNLNNVLEAIKRGAGDK